MRLPTKRDYASTSMRAAKRNPVLQDTNFVKAQAAQQRFYGIDPSAYMTLGSAQSRAATARGNVGLAMGTAALKIDSAMQKVDETLQANAADTALAELKAWTADYSAEVGMTDLTIYDGRKYGYENLEEQYKKDLEDKKSELSQKYKITNGLIKQQYNNNVLGIETALGNTVSEFARNAQIDVGKAGIQKRLNKPFSTEEELMDTLYKAQSFYSAEEMVKIESAAYSNFEFGKVNTQIESIKNNNNALISKAQELENRILSGASKLRGEQASSLEERLNSLIKNNINNATIAINNAQTQEDLTAAYESALASGNYAGSNEEDASPHILKLRALYLERASKIELEDISSSMKDETGVTMLNDSTLRMGALAIQNSPHLTEADRGKAETELVKNVSENIAFKLTIEAKSGRDPQALMDDLKNGLNTSIDSMLPENSYSDLKPDVITSAEKVTADLIAQANREETRLSKATIDAMEAKSWAWNPGSVADPKRQAALAEGAWNEYLKIAQRKNPHLNFEQMNPQRLLQEFAQRYKVIPPNIGRQLDADMKSQDPNVKIAALQEYVALHNLSGSSLTQRTDLGVDKAQSTLAISLANTFSHLPPEEQMKAVSKAVTADFNSTNEGRVNSYKTLSNAETYKTTMGDAYSKMRELDDSLPDELSPEFMDIAKVHYEDNYLSHGNSDIAAAEAISTTLSASYIIDGSVFAGKHPLRDNQFTNANHSNSDDNPAWESMKELSALAGYEVEDVEFVPLQGMNGFELVDPMGRQLVDPDGNPLFLMNDSLTESGLALKNKLSSQQALESAVSDEEDFDSALTPAQFYDEEHRYAGLTEEEKRYLQESEGRADLSGDLGGIQTPSSSMLQQDLELIEAAKQASLNPDPSVSEQGKKEWQIRTSSEFIKASEEGKEKMLSRGREIVAEKLRAQQEEEQRKQKEAVEQDIWSEASA